MAEVQIIANNEYEQAVLGSLLIDPVATATMADLLKPSDFYLVSHQWIYEAVIDLGERADLLTVAQRLASQNRLDDIGGESYLAQLAVSVPNALNIEAYAEGVGDDATRRRLVQACSQVAKLAFDRKIDASDVSEQAVSIMDQAAAGRESGDVIPARLATDGFLKRIEESAARGNVLPGIPSGIAALDAVTGGWQEADFAIIAGAPGSGKTSLAVQAILYAAKLGKRCVFFSLEMPETQITERFISCMSQVAYSRMGRAWSLTEDELGRVTRAAMQFSDLPIWIVDTGRLTTQGYIARVLRLQRQHGIDLAGIDQLQLMSPTRAMKDRRLEIVEITRELKLSGKKLGGVPLLAMSQLSRTGYAGNAEPSMSDLKESGSIESDADKVIVLYTPDEQDKARVMVKIAKNRKGPTGKVRVAFDRATSTMREEA